VYSGGEGKVQRTIWGWRQVGQIGVIFAQKSERAATGAIMCWTLRRSLLVGQALDQEGAT